MNCVARVIRIVETVKEIAREPGSNYRRRGGDRNEIQDIVSIRILTDYLSRINQHTALQFLKIISY